MAKDVSEKKPQGSRCKCRALRVYDAEEKRLLHQGKACAWFKRQKRLAARSF